MRACGVGDATALVLNLTIRDLAVGCKQAQGATLIHVHQASVACHIGAEDRREPTLDTGRACP
jgi:hypothetical protein